MARRWRQVAITVVVSSACMAAAAQLTDTRGLEAIAAAMACWCAITARQRSLGAIGRQRTGWLAITTGFGWAAVELLWTLVTSPANSTGRAATLPTGTLPMILLLVGVLCLRPPRRTDAEDATLLLDLMIVPAALGIVLWATVLQPAIADNPNSLLVDVLAVAEGTTAVALMLAVYVLALRLSSSSQPRAALLAAGLAGIGAGRLFSAAAVVHGSTGWETAGATAVAISITLFAIVLGRERRQFTVGAGGWSPSPPGGEPVWRMWVSYPLLIVLALLTLAALFDGRESTSDAAMTVALITVVGLVVGRHAVALRMARDLANRLADRADRDPLTNLLNHRALHKRLDRELVLARAEGVPLAVVMIDVDRFKQINDELGHVVGDHVLRAIAATVSRTCRDNDVAARYAGDEFVLALPGLSPLDAPALGERLLAEVAGLAYWPGPEAQHPVSISVGIAITRTGRRSTHQMIAAADSALYDAKRLGRNRYSLVNADLPEHGDDPYSDPRRLLIAHPAF